MESISIKKLAFLICFCLISVLAFTACKEKTVYTKKNIEKEKTSSDSDSDYWKDPPEDDIYVPTTSDDGTGETPYLGKDDNQTSSGGASNKVDTDGDDTPNIKDDDIDDDGLKNDVDTDVDGDGTKNENDTDIDGDGVKNENDNDMDGDGVGNDKDDDIDGDGDKNEDDITPEGPINNKNEGPFVSSKS